MGIYPFPGIKRKDYSKVVTYFLPEGIYMGPPIPPETKYNPLNIDEIGEIVRDS